MSILGSSVFISIRYSIASLCFLLGKVCGITQVLWLLMVNLHLYAFWELCGYFVNQFHCVTHLWILILLSIALFFKLKFREIKELHCITTITIQEEIFSSLLFISTQLLAAISNLFRAGMCQEEGQKRWVESLILTGTVYKLSSYSLGLFCFRFCFSFLMASCVIFFKVFQLGPSENKSSDVEHEFYVSSLPLVSSFPITTL